MARWRERSAASSIEWHLEQGAHDHVLTVLSRPRDRYPGIPYGILPQ
jgi:hypothetical protein